MATPMPIIQECHSPSFKSKLKSTISCFTCKNDDVQRLGGGGSGCRRSGAAAPRSPRSWLRSAAEDLEIRDRCLGLIGRRGKNTRRRYSAEDFRYDVESYSLNFDDEVSKEEDAPFGLSFAARLPATPERSLVAVS